MNDDQRLLASAALDGDVTSEERARAAADPDVVAEIERLRRVREAMQAATAPSVERREAAIAAAIAVFAESSAGTGRPTATAPPPSLADRRWSRWMAPLAAAAAVIVIAVGGIVAVRRDGGNDGDSASSATAELERSSELLAATDQESAAAPAATSAQNDAAGDAAATGEVQTTTPAAAGAAEDSQRPADATAAPLVTLTSSDDLVAFVRARDGVAPAGVATCAGGTFVGPAYYVVDGTPISVEVLQVDEPSAAVAVRTDDCAIVATAPLP